jgi:hypothetical protein
MNQTDILKIVEQFSRGDEPDEGLIKVSQVPDSKTVYVETVGDVGRSIYFTEYRVDGKTYWAGYSQLSNTVFVSKTH